MDQPIWRRYLEMQAEIVGPVFNRIWNTPNNDYMERLKHTVEPFVNIQRTTAIDNLESIVQLDSLDSVVGETTRVTYGLNNRFYAKRRSATAGRSHARDHLGVAEADAITPTREPRRSTCTTAPATRARRRRDYRRCRCSSRTQTSDATHATLRAEYDTQFMALRTIGADGSYGYGGWFDVSAGWSQRRLIPELKGFDDP